MGYAILTITSIAHTHTHTPNANANADENNKIIMAKEFRHVELRVPVMKKRAIIVKRSVPIVFAIAFAFGAGEIEWAHE